MEETQLSGCVIFKCSPQILGHQVVLWLCFLSFKNLGIADENMAL